MFCLLLTLKCLFTCPLFTIVISLVYSIYPNVPAHVPGWPRQEIHRARICLAGHRGPPPPFWGDPKEVVRKEGEESKNSLAALARRKKGSLNFSIKIQSRNLFSFLFSLTYASIYSNLSGKMSSFLESLFHNLITSFNSWFNIPLLLEVVPLEPRIFSVDRRGGLETVSLKELLTSKEHMMEVSLEFKSSVGKVNLW